MSLPNGFVRFSNVPGAVIRGKGMAMNSQGRLMLSTAFCEEHDITQKHAELYFSKKTNQVAVRLTNKGGKRQHSVTEVKHHKDDKCVRRGICLAGLFRANGIDKNSIRIKDYSVPESNLIIIKIERKGDDL